MVEIVKQLLRLDNYYGGGDLIEFAKGRDKIPMSIKEGMEQINRKRWHKR